jgi:uncharacterized HAD superfamily protein/hypoxanthine phosphoribosyltransferase
MNYRNLGQMASTVARNLGKVPRDIDIVIGIPRSGMLPATMLSLCLNLPLAELSTFLKGHVLSGGYRYSHYARKQQTPQRILLVDDSVLSGAAMDEAVQQIRKTYPEMHIIRAAVYVDPGARDKLDLCMEEVPAPRIFEWNVAHSRYMQEACIDMDGFLCENPTDFQNDDGPLYEDFVQKANPLVIPTVKVKAIVTCRLERYRQATEDWLHSHGVIFERLFLMDTPSQAERQRRGNYARFKAEHCRQQGATIFIESCEAQALEICRLAARPVICWEKQSIHNPTGLAKFAFTTSSHPHSTRSRLMEKLVRRFPFLQSKDQIADV